MNFRDTIYALRDETKRTTIYALLGFNESKISMGLRRAWHGTDLRDPIIDGNVFMLCGDAWDTMLKCAITRPDDLVCTPDEDIEIRLRGVTYDVTVDLGRYMVRSMKVEIEEDVYFLDGPRKFPSAIRLEIERK